MECPQTLSLSRKRRKTNEPENNDSRTKHDNSVASKRAKLTQEQQNNTLSQTETEVYHRCGKVLRMHLTNFMCHANLKIDFIKNINFLVGTNGSGKSAILAALVLGLGGKAKDTNRAGSLKQFIKTGETSAKIEITLSNDGGQAYEPEKYGNNIIVTRNITQSSATTYTIKNEKGQVISKKYDDLARILLYHNVQVDNNVFVLNQDSAREFLKEFEPKNNYRLFLKATQIEMVYDKLTECHHAQKEQKYNLQCNEKALEESKKEIAKLKDKLHELMSIENLKDLLKVHEIELLWLKVTEIENELKAIADNITKLEERKEQLTSKVENKEEHETQLSQRLSKYKSDIVEKTTAYSQENTRCIEIKAKVTIITKRCLEVSSFIDTLKKRKSFYETQIKDIENHIEERSQQNVGDIAETRKRNEQSLEQLLRNKEENLAVMCSAKRDVQLFVNNKLQKEEQLREIRSTKENYNENLRRIAQQIANIKNTAKDKLLIYGEHIPLLLAEITAQMKAGKFSEMPRGPIGNYIQVKHPKYRDVVEQQLGGILQAFIVSNKKDCHTLEAIYRNKFPNCPKIIITTKFQKQVYDVRSGRVQPPPGTCLLMDEIRCTDPVIMNCLIDRAQIETILLVDSKEIAENLTAHRENVPRNLQKAIVPQPGLEYFAEPNYRMYSVKIRPARFIQVNINDRIAQMEKEKDDIQLKIEAVDAKLTELGPQIRSDLKYIEEKRILLERYESQKRDIMEKISELENYEYPEYNEVDILKKELGENEKKLNEVQQRLDAKTCELSDAKNEEAAILQEFESHKNAMHSIEEEIIAIRNNVDGLAVEIRSLSNHFKQNEEKLQHLNVAMEQVMEQRRVKNTSLKEATRKAQLKGERVPNERSEEEILDKMQKLKAKLRQRSQINDDPEELRCIISAKETAMEKEIINHKNFVQSVEMLGNALKHRATFIQTVRNHMVFILDFSFKRILQLRKFIGNIQVDHKNRMLDVTVIPRETGNNNAVSTTRSLSGGERSYSTVAFLVALWGCVDHPFFFLDEYDVFTDDVNREFITRLLINEGESRPQRQYTFLTPQDMAIESKKNIKINKLAEPKRK